MSAECVAAVPDRIASAAKDRRYRFDLATPADNKDLLQFSAHAEMTGAIRFSFDRSFQLLYASTHNGAPTECRGTFEWPFSTPRNLPYQSNSLG